MVLHGFGLAKTVTRGRQADMKLKHIHKKSEQGMTLVELMIAMVISDLKNAQGGKTRVASDNPRVTQPS